MISKNLYFNLVVRIVLIVIISLLTGYMIATGVSFRMVFLCLIALVFLTVSLIDYLNSTNRKIRYFFDSVRNDESNLFFPVSEKNKTLLEIYKSMNRVNEQIKKLKIENRDQENYFRTLIEQLAIGIMTFDKKGHILHSNSAARKLFGIEILTHIRQTERIDTKLYQVLKNINPNERRLVPVTTELGEIQLSLKTASFKKQDDELLIITIQDIKHELDEKEVDSWIKLIRILMHEIMNSITPVISLSESLSGIYMKDSEPLPPDKVTHENISTTIKGLNVIKEQGKGLTSFVESYRQLTRIPEPDKKPFKVSDLFSHLEILYAPLREKDYITLNFNLEDPELEIYADQKLISQVLINLIRNAVEAIGQRTDGVISISAGINAFQRKEICVTDNGPGIPPENLDEIFVPFFTTRQSGSGIGLSVSRQIMKVHGGSLKVRSFPEKETTFCMAF